MDKVDNLTKLKSIAKTLISLVESGAKIPKFKYQTFLGVLQQAYIDAKSEESKLELQKLIDFFKKHDNTAQIIHELKVYAHRLGVFCGELVYPISEKPKVTVDVSGFRYHFMLPETTSSFEEFVNNYNNASIKMPKKITDIVIYCLKDAYNSLTEENMQKAAAKYYNNYQQDNLVLLTTGWPGHAVCMVIYKDKLIICNKGQGSEKNICAQVFQIPDRSKLTYDIMARLLNAKYHGYFSEKEPSTTMEYMLKALKSELDLKRISSIPGTNQKEPICVQASLKTAIRTALQVLADEENQKNKNSENFEHIDATKYYKEWSKHDRKTGFKKLLQWYEQKLISKDVFDEILIRTAFVQNDPNKPLEMERFNKIMEIVDVKKHLPLIKNLLWQEKLDDIIFPGWTKKLEPMKRAIANLELKFKDKNLIQFDSKHPLYPIALNNQMMDAIENKNYDVMEKLLLISSKNNFFNDSLLNESWGPMHYLIANGDKKGIKIFLDNKVNPFTYPGIPLIRLAIYLKANDIVKMFMDYRQQNQISTSVVPSAKDSMGYTLLHTAIANQNFEIAKYLIEQGADLTVRNNMGHNPIELAEIIGCKNKFDECLSKVNLKLKTKYELSPPVKTITPLKENKSYRKIIREMKLDQIEKINKKLKIQ